MQPYPRAPDLVWPGQLLGTGCLNARALDTGFPPVVWCFCSGPGCGWVWVSVTPPVLAGVSGGCVWIPFVVSSLFCRPGFVVFVVGVGFRPAPHLSWLGIWDARGCVHAPPAPRRFWFRCVVWACVLGSGFRLRPVTPWGGAGVCVCSCARPAWSPAPPGWGCCAGVRVCSRTVLVPRLSWLGCVVWAWVLGPGLGCAPLFVVGLSGCVFFSCPALALWCWSLAVPVPGLVVPVPPFPLFRAGLLVLFFFFPPSVVCVCAFWVSLPPVGRRPWLGVAGCGWVVPLCPFGGPVFVAFWMGGLAAPCGVGGRFGGCGPFSLPPPSTPVFCFGEGV